MELELSRVDYTIVGITSPNCLKLLPSSFTKDPQKIVVGDCDGILQIFTVKKDDIQLNFKTLPGSKINSVQLGGALGNTNDKIFTASENEIRGYTKKGKLFLTFDSGMTEPITSMYVLGSDLFLCGKHIYNHYRDCKEIGSYLCGDRIVDVIAFYSDKTHRLMSLIACEGRMIRALEHARVTSSMEVESAPTLLHIYEDNDDDDGVKTILFGTVDGRVGIVDIERLQGFNRWLINNTTNNNSSAISCMDSYKMTGDGVKNLIIGRRDGNIEVYMVNVADKMDESTLIFVHNCNESVTAIQCGIVSVQNCDEIIVSTYTGRIFGLTTANVDKNVGGDSSINGYIFSQDITMKITRLKNELDDLQIKVGKEREKYQNSAQSFFEELSAIPLLSINDTFVLSKETATYTLIIEVATPIDNILLQSNVPIDLLDVEKNSAVVSYSDAEHNLGNFLLATYRCQINTNRLEIKFQTVEGQYGTLQAYVTPLIQPKCSKLQQYEIKPLSLHYRIYKFDENRPLNELSIKGAFSLAEIHTWIKQCLPEVPEKPTIGENTCLIFESSFLGTILECIYQKGEAHFKSDNISTISILKEFVTKEATKKKIKVDINSVICDQSIPFCLELLQKKLFKLKTQMNKISILEALNELEINENETINMLTMKYKKLLTYEKELRHEFQCQPENLNRLYNLISDLYIDYNKFKGINGKMKLSKLREILETYYSKNNDEEHNNNVERLIAFFQPDL